MNKTAELHNGASESTPLPAHEMIVAYARALEVGAANDAAEWLLEQSMPAQPDRATMPVLQTLALLYRHRNATTVTLMKESPPEELERMTRVVMSDSSEPASDRIGGSSYDEEWLNRNQMDWLGFLDVDGGGMGSVELAWHRKLKQEVILKMARKEHFEERFDREIEVSAKLISHPNIAGARFALNYGYSSVLVLDYIPGAGLKRHVELNGPMPWPKACECIRQGAQGLAFAHGEHIIHRDIKPSNLVLSHLDGKVRLLDWGLAIDFGKKQVDNDVTAIGAGLGTPDYCPPEQALNFRAATERSDLYGLGCTWYELMVGKPPFADYPGSLIEAHAKQPPPALPEELEVPEDVERVLRQLLEKNPDRRFESVAAFLAALDHATLKHAAVPKPPPWKAILVLIAVLIGFVVWQQFSPINSGNPAPTANDLVVKFEDPTGTPDRTGTLGLEVVRASEGDEVTLQADFDTPVYSYLIAFSPDGLMHICSPADESTAPVLARSVRYPAAGGSQGRVFRLNDGLGLQAFAVVASRSPLPPFQTFLATAGTSPTLKIGKIDPNIAWSYDGESIRPFHAKGKIDVRSAGLQSEGPRGVVDKLANWLKSYPGVETVRIKAFAVVERKP